MGQLAFATLDPCFKNLPDYGLVQYRKSAAGFCCRIFPQSSRILDIDNGIVHYFG